MHCATVTSSRASVRSFSCSSPLRRRRIFSEAPATRKMNSLCASLCSRSQLTHCTRKSGTGRRGGTCVGNRRVGFRGGAGTTPVVRESIDNGGRAGIGADSSLTFDFAATFSLLRVAPSRRLRKVERNK